MRVLLIKMSSMGDIIHTFPALTDAVKNNPELKFDWLVEDAFANLPKWHQSVDTVIPISLRQWRKNKFSLQELKKIYASLQQVKTHHYDLVLDAQGLFKSALAGSFARGPKAGLDLRSAREFTASLFYHKKYAVNFYQHAVIRMRTLFSLAFNYSLDNLPLDFGLNIVSNFEQSHEKYLVFLHGTSWRSKEWPEHFLVAISKPCASCRIPN